VPDCETSGVVLGAAEPLRRVTAARLARDHRLLRLDLGIHYEGWSFQDAAD